MSTPIVMVARGQAFALALACLDAAPAGRHEDRETLLRAISGHTPRLVATWRSPEDLSTLARIDVLIDNAGAVTVYVAGNGIDPDPNGAVDLLSLQLGVATVARTIKAMLGALAIERSLL